MGQVSAGWARLTEEQRLAWWRLARQERTQKRPGRKPRALRGQELYVKINRVRALLGLELASWPPPKPAFEANPVRELRITAGGARLALTGCGRPAKDLMVFAQPPQPASRTCGKSGYAFIGLLPAPKNGESNITQLYLQKLKEWRRLGKFRRVRLAGSRICIRTWPQSDGWEDRSQTWLSTAVAPER